MTAADETTPELLDWYALHVYSGQETKIKRYLENEVRVEQLEDRITEVLIPAEDVVEMRNGKKKTKNRVFFPGYMLVQMTLDNQTSQAVLNTPGVINFVGPKNKPQKVQPGEIDRILKRVQDTGETMKIEAPFQVGEAIKVIDGPFNEFTGFVDEVNVEKHKVKVMVSIFGRPTPVELDFLQVAPEK